MLKRSKLKITLTSLAAAVMAITGLTAAASPASAGPGPFYWIINVKTGQAMLPYEQSKAPNTPLVLQTKANLGAMHWKIDGSGIHRQLRNRHSHYCALAAGVDTFVRQHDCGLPGTTWIVSDKDGMFAGDPVEFMNSATSTCLDRLGATVQVKPCVGATNQRWRLEHVPGT